MFEMHVEHVAWPLYDSSSSAHSVHSSTPGVGIRGCQSHASGPVQSVGVYSLHELKSSNDCLEWVGRLLVLDLTKNTSRMV